MADTWTICRVCGARELDRERDVCLACGKRGSAVEVVAVEDVRRALLRKSWMACAVCGSYWSHFDTECPECGDAKSVWVASAETVAADIGIGLGEV